MEIDKRLFFIAAIITIMLFIIIYSLNVFLHKQREGLLSDQMNEIIDDYEEMQTLSLMGDVFGQEGTCLALQSRMSEMDKSLWDLGTKIDKYRQLTEEYLKEPFYIGQKKKFNRREVLYFSLLKNLKEKCNFTQPTILFFYKKAEECKNCDAMSFVLLDLKKEVKEEVAIFSFDADLELSSVEILIKYYNVTTYPCLVVEDVTSCGLHSKDALIDLICEQKDFSKCKA